LERFWRESGLKFGLKIIKFAQIGHSPRGGRMLVNLGTLGMMNKIQQILDTIEKITRIYQSKQ
jgi:hypothetical protein